MAKTETSRRDDKHHLSRRALIKWSAAAGAALGVSRSKIFEILERTAGKGVAFAASEAPTMRSVHFIAGNGGLAFTQAFWPHVDIAKAGNANFAWKFPGQTIDVTGIKNQLALGMDTPWQSLAPTKQVTCFVMGNNETHTTKPQSTVGLNGNSIFAVASALQAASPSTIPMIAVGGAVEGTAPGAAVAAAVGNADGMVSLFGSAASRNPGGLLANPTDAALYKAHYDAFVQLNRAANRATTKTAYLTAGGAAKFLGQNLADKLAVTTADMTRYGVTTGTRAELLNVAKTLIVTAKAFKAGITNSVILPFLQSDPHGFWDGGDFNTYPQQIKAVLDGFMGDLSTYTDDATGQSLADDTLMSFSGDTYKSPVQRGGWPDGTPMNSNLCIMYSAGHLLPGWFGSVDRNSKVMGVDATGAPVAYNGASMAKFGLASMAYAIAKRDDRAIQNFTGGVTVGGVFGNLKDK